MNNISLKQGTVVMLSLDSTMVYVESIGDPNDPEATPIYIAVVALPEQPSGQKDDRVFTPGRVGSKKISPYSQATKEVPVADLSERNQKFLQTYVAWRDEHGANYVDMTEEERAAMTVTKVKPERKPKKEKASDVDKHLRRKCGQCTEQPGHPNHHGDDGHAFVEPPVKQPKEPKAPREPKASKAPREPRERTAKADLRYCLDSTKSLDQAAKQKDKYKDGNRGHKVYTALKTLGSERSVAEVMVKVAELHGATWSRDPELIVSNTLRELMKPEFGSVTVRV